MPVLKEQHTSIKEFIITPNSCFYLKDDGLYNESIKYDSIESDFFGSIIEHNESVIVVQSFNGWFFLIENRIFKNQKYNGYYCHGIKDINELFFWDIEKDKLAVIDGGNVRLLNYGKSVLSVPNGYIDLDETAFIKFLDLSFKERAEFAVKDLGHYYSGAIETPNKISTYSGGHENTLVFTLENGDVILLDSLNGSLISRFNGTFVIHNLQPTNTNSPVFWGLSHNTFIEINIVIGTLNDQIDITNELKRMAEIPEATPNYIFIHTAVIYDNLIYFLADINYLGTFDPVQKTITWWHKFEFEKKGTMLKGGAKNLQITDTKVYVLDNAGTLHIFER